MTRENATQQNQNGTAIVNNEALHFNRWIGKQSKTQGRR